MELKVKKLEDGPVLAKGGVRVWGTDDSNIEVTGDLEPSIGAGYSSTF